jgi:hypothetical protein
METAKVILKFLIMGQLTLLYIKTDRMNYQLERIAHNTVRR